MTPFPSQVIGDPSSACDVTDYETTIYREMLGLEVDVPEQVVMQEEITPLDRGMLMDWLDRLHYKCQLTTATYYRCCGIIDRVISVAPVKREELLIIGCAAMLIASKVEDHKPMSADQPVIVAEHAITKEQIIAAESQIMSLLNFNVTFPTIFFFLTHFLRLTDGTMDTVLYARYIAEICTSSADFIGVRPSAIAAAAIMATLTMRGSEPWTERMAAYTGYSFGDLAPYVRVIHAMLLEEDRAETAFMRRKYGSIPFRRVAEYALPEELPCDFSI